MKAGKGSHACFFELYVIEILCKNMLTAYERQFIENVTLVMAKDSLHYAVNLF